MCDNQYHNDFNLEELELIQNNIHWNDCAEVNQKLLKLNRKLEEMISNYCDHDWKNTYNEREVWLCSKCGLE
jgi:hypothetical protein